MKPNNDQLSRVRNASRNYADAFRRWSVNQNPERDQKLRDDVEEKVMVLVRVLRDHARVPPRQIERAMVQGMRHYPSAMEFLANIGHEPDTR